MERWVKAGVIGTFLSAALGFWPILNGGAIVGHPILTVIKYGAPVLAGILLLASVLIAFRHPRELGRKRFSSGADRNRFDAVSDQLANLTAFEIFALANLLSTDGMTGEQFNLVVERLGFPATSLMQQNQVKETFEIINSRTALLAIRDSEWTIKPDLRIYVSAIVDQMKPLFGY